MIRCPWHDEKTPSCSVTRGNDGTVRARCFGCGATGDAFTLVAQVYGLDARHRFLEVLDAAADLAGLMRPERRARGDRPPPARAIPRRPDPVADETPDDGVLDLVAQVLSRVAPVPASGRHLARAEVRFHRRVGLLRRAARVEGRIDLVLRNDARVDPMLQDGL